MSNSTLNQVPNRANDRWANEVESVFGELAIDRHRARLQSRADVNIESMLPVVEKTLDAVWEASSLKNELDAISVSTYLPRLPTTYSALFISTLADHLIALARPC